jgi:hypothetical protein
MKAEVKSINVRRIIHLLSLPLLVPVGFLLSCMLAIWAFRFKPYQSALEEFGVRVVDSEDDGTQNNCRKVYVALELLNRHDKEKLELVKKHIRIIVLGLTIPKVCYYMGTGVCLLNLQKIPVEKRATTIIWWLVYEASRAKFAGKFGHYLGTSEKVKNLCKEEQRRTMQKFHDEPS